MCQYDKLPGHATLKPSRFNVEIPQQELDDFKTLLKLSPLGPKTYENLGQDRKFGVSYAWLTETKKYWLEKFDWRNCEKHINNFPNYTVSINDDAGNAHSIHFVALFSLKAEAIPLVFLHGWPGSFLEFLGVLQCLRDKYTAEELPYHVIVPSLPGYTFSEGPPLNNQWACEDMALIIHRLMVGLGLGSGYIAQGGDIGSRVARILAAKYDGCIGVHLNFNPMPQPEGIPHDSISKLEQSGLKRAEYTMKFGLSYARQHGMRPATTGFVLSSSPIALLSWIGEKFLEWTDNDPSLDAILESVTLYWLTSTVPRALYPYVQESGDVQSKGEIHTNPKYYCKKPMGYSYFAKEMLPIPVSWVATTGNLVWHRAYEEGGHFAAMEKPELLLQDVEDFIKQLK